MILVDASVWIDHIRGTDAWLSRLLLAGQVLAHPFVIGEIALGHLRNRSLILAELQNLPQATAATDAEVLHFIDRHKLFGRGIGYVDAHLLAAVSLTDSASLWTRDKQLLRVAEASKLAAHH